jgi:GntR family transcriptional regulator, arabinose operon transcriptional repressor
MKPKNSPTYIQIEKKLISYFEKNSFSNGDKLPTEHNLMELFNVSRTTIRKALQVLKNKGLIDRSQGSGTFYTGKQINISEGTKTLGLINYSYMDYIYTEILRGIEDEIHKSGYSLIISNSHLDDEKQHKAIDQLISRSIDGLILEPAHNLQIQEDHPALALLETAGIPVVTIHWGINHKSVSTVTLDDFLAGGQAAQYLLDKGHTKIGYIYKEDFQPGLDRYYGFRQKLEEQGCPLEDRYCLSYTSENEEENNLQGYILSKKIIQENRIPPTAVFYFNDNLAFQGYKAFTELGLRIPEDISVLGFDDHSNATIVSPPLSTFSHPKYNMGSWAAKILIDEIENNTQAKPMKLIFKPKLIERSSVADDT